METTIIPNSAQSLLTLLCKHASLCRMRLSAFYESTVEFIQSEGEKKEVFSDFTELFFESLGNSMSEIMQLSWTTNYNHNLQNEIRTSLLSSHRDRHDEIYFLLIKKVLTDLRRCQHFCIGMSLYHKGFSRIFKDGMPEDLVKPAIECAMKLAPGFYQWHLLGAIAQLKKLIEGVIPPSDLSKVLPDDLQKKPEVITVPETPLDWKGSKTDLAEVIWAMSKSKRVVNTATGKPVTIGELTQHFEALFGITINVTGLMQARKDSYKAINDGVTFTSFLSEQVDGYITKQ